MTPSWTWRRPTTSLKSVTTQKTTISAADVKLKMSSDGRFFSLVRCTGKKEQFQSGISTLQHGMCWLNTWGNHLWTSVLMSNGLIQTKMNFIQLGREADHSPPRSAEVRNAWSYPSSPRYAFMASCLINQKICLRGMVLSWAQGQLDLF